MHLRAAFSPAWAWVRLAFCSLCWGNDGMIWLCIARSDVTVGLGISAVPSRSLAPRLKPCPDTNLLEGLQYFGIFGSTRSAHAVIPPARLWTFVNPACCRNATAFALRPPILQWATISRLEASSLTRFGKCLSGIRCPLRLQIWYSCGSRTSD